MRRGKFDLSAALGQVVGEASLRDTSLLTADVLGTSWAKYYQIVEGFKGTLSICGTDVSVEVGLPAYFPNQLPKARLTPWDALGFIPHVDHFGNVCFLDAEGIILDRNQPGAIIKDTIELMIRVLEDGYTGKNHADFMDEFDAYWVQARNIAILHSYITPDDQAREIILAEGKNGYVYVADTERAVRAFLSGHDPKHFTIRKALYIPLRPGALLKPPRPENMWTVEEVRRFIHGNTEQKTRKAIDNLTQKYKQDEVIVLKLPRPSGGENLIGIRFYRVEKRHPLLEGGQVNKAMPLLLERRDKEYILPRGGGRSSLSDKRVLMIGCGAIGGYLAYFLAQSGILHLSLVDPQKLAPENIFRHRLGRRYLGVHKSDALKTDLEETLPYLHVESYPEGIEQLLNSGRLRLHDFDLIITALGIPTLELYLNEVIQEAATAPPAIFCWLEPYGIGGHALLSNNASQGSSLNGCYECLYAGDTDDHSLFNRASFAAAGQSFAKNVAGCGSLFVPFGALDAIKTAEVAVRLAIKTLERQETSNPLYSWKGSSEDFKTAGYKLSPRFSLDERQFKETRLAYIHSACPTCSREAA